MDTEQSTHRNFNSPDGENSDSIEKKILEASPEDLIASVKKAAGHQYKKFLTTGSSAKIELKLNIKLLCLLAFMGVLLSLFISIGWLALLGLLTYGLLQTPLLIPLCYALPILVHGIASVYLWRQIHQIWRLFGMKKTWQLLTIK